MTKCGCETGLDCTTTTICQCELVADKLAEALETLVREIRPLRADDGDGPLFNALGDAEAAIKEYRE